MNEDYYFEYTYLNGVVKWFERRNNIEVDGEFAYQGKLSPQNIEAAIKEQKDTSIKSLRKVLT